MRNQQNLQMKDERERLGAGVKDVRACVLSKLRCTIHAWLQTLSEEPTNYCNPLIKIP